MSIASTSTAPAWPSIEMLDYDKTWDVPQEEAPRPSNAFMLFVKWNSRYIDRRSNAKKVGPIWRSAPPEVEAHFINLAAQVELKHKERFPGYVFAPKKKAKTKEERKENVRPYPSSPQRQSRTLGREEMGEEAVGQGSNLGIPGSDEATQHQRTILQSSSAANYMAYGPTHLYESSHHDRVAQQHSFNIHHNDPRFYESSLPAFMEDPEPRILSVEEEEEEDTTTATVSQPPVFGTDYDNARLDESSVPAFVEEPDILCVEEEEAMTAAAVEIEPVDNDDVIFSVDDLNYLSSVMFGFDINDWLIFEH